MAAMAGGAANAAGDARAWDEDRYRRSIVAERARGYLTVFRTAFATSSSGDGGDSIITAACSDGSLVAFSLMNAVAVGAPGSKLVNTTRNSEHRSTHSWKEVDPVCVIQGHKGPAYDLKFYGEGDEKMLVSCGDDGHIRGWRWNEIPNCSVPLSMQGNHVTPVLDLVNMQKEGPWGSRSPIPENNAIAINNEEGSIISAAGDGCAYCWDVVTGKCKMTFEGHSDYLHCVTVRKSSSQIITGSEDGTVRLWDCRNGKCTQIIHREHKKSKDLSWISSVALDSSESWLACGTGNGIAAWNLLSNECIFDIDRHAPVQDLVFNKNQILAVGSEPVMSRFTISGKVLPQIKCAPQSAFSILLHPSGAAAISGYGGLVDIISEFGSHLCTVRVAGTLSLR